MQKAGAQKCASALNLAIVCPDTSPRGSNIAGENDCYDIGTGAGFYVNATQDPWKRTYQMFDYINKELPISLEQTHLPLQMNNASIFGHSVQSYF